LAECSVCGAKAAKNELTADTRMCPECVSPSHQPTSTLPPEPLPPSENSYEPTPAAAACATG
jgi:hypothetical protein